MGPLVSSTGHITVPVIFNGLIAWEQLFAMVYVEITPKGAHSFSDKLFKVGDNQQVAIIPFRVLS